LTAPIYLDYAATTPVDPAVARAMSEVLSAAREYGNAGSIAHVFGRRTEARGEAARAQVAALIGAHADDVVFTSGATESNNLALLGVARASGDRARHIISSRIEHKAVLDPCKQLEREGFTVTYLAPDANGSVTPDAVRAWLRPDTAIVSIMHVNNETGVIQDIRAIGELCRAHGVPFHTDAAQSVGKLPLDVNELPVDLLSFTAHKIYGPQGIGALYVRSQVRPRIRPVTFGGGQERGLRPGTLPLHQVVAFGVACDLARSALATEPARIEVLRDRLWRALERLGGVHLNGEAAPRLAEILNVSFEGVEGESLVTALTGVAVTTGSACNSASGEPSYVLRALGRSVQVAQSSLRFSFGRWTTLADIDRAASDVTRHVERLRSVAGFSAVGDAASSKSVREPALRLASGGATLGENGQITPTAEAGSSVYEFDTLSPAARRYFDTLPCAGTVTLERDGAGVTAGAIVQGEAGSVAEGAWVKFQLQVADGSVKAALFQAYGCPHTLAVTAWLTEQLPGRPKTDLVPGTPAAWLKSLNVPVEKLGRLLTVEDALRASLLHWA
jgi:cysteine desulfurase